MEIDNNYVRLPIDYTAKESYSYNDVQTIMRNYHERIDKLQKRLDITKAFCDSLWEELKEK